MKHHLTQMEHTFKNNELNALISLLDEPDDEVFGKVRDRLFSYGLEAVPLLEDAWDSSFEQNEVQKRIEGIIHDIQFDNVFQSFRKWKQSPDKDLLTGFLLVAKYHYPEMKDKEIIDKVGLIIQDVWLELNPNSTLLEKVKILNHIIFDVHNFKSNKSDIHAPSNSYINLMLETKKGNALSLSILYMIVAQSLKIPVYGVNLPQNFIMACTDRLINPEHKISPGNIQFYINAFNGGLVFTKNEIDLFLRQIGVESEEKFYLPCDNITIIRRVFNNLIVSYENRGKPEKIEELKRLQEALG